MDTNVYSRRSLKRLCSLNPWMWPLKHPQMRSHALRSCLRSKKAVRREMQMRDLVNFRHHVSAIITLRWENRMPVNTSRLVLLCVRSPSIVCGVCLQYTWLWLQHLQHRFSSSQRGGYFEREIEWSATPLTEWVAPLNIFQVRGLKCFLFRE